VREYIRQPPSYWWLDIFPKLSAPEANLGIIEIIQEAGQTIFVPAGKM
jgi:hypothetical protein